MTKQRLSLRSFLHCTRRLHFRLSAFALRCALAGIAAFALITPALPAAEAGSRPNMIFIMADDLGYGELGSYGQKIIATPHLDRMAAEGMRFTQFYAGSTVCAPARSVLMTGQHTGHTTVRGNAGGRGGAQTLAATDVTVARVLQQAGYATGLVGKWGLGERDSTGAPWKQGFDYFFGFLNQTHAHNHFPDHLWRNDRRVNLGNDLVPVGSVPGVGYATRRVEYANDLFFEEAESFVERNRSRPFFLYLSLTVPHANNERSRVLGDGQEVPDYGPYAQESWPDSIKGQAAMITRMDEGVGRLIGRLKELGLDERTVVMFTSDNGPHREGGPDYDPAFFNAGGGLRGIKRDLTEGGIRVPMIVRWPGIVPEGTVSGHASYFGDMLPTFADMAGVDPGVDHDGISMLPELRDDGALQRRHAFLYWEFYERLFRQAVVLEGRWKGIRAGGDDATMEIYDLSADLAEERNLAARRPDLVRRISEIMEREHVPNEYWGFPREAAQ